MFILDRYIAPIDFFIFIYVPFSYHQKQDPWLSWTKTKFMKSLHLVTLGNWMTRSWPRLKKLWCGWVSARHRLGKPWPKSSKGQQLLFMKENMKSKASELLSMQSKMEGYKIFGAADFQEVKTQLANVGKCFLVLVYLDKSLPFSLLVLFCFWFFFGSCPFLVLVLFWFLSFFILCFQHSFDLDHFYL